MNIVNLSPRSGGYVLVQEGLKRSHRQLGTWVGDHHLSLPIGTDIGQDMCTAIHFPTSERTGIKSLQGGQQLLRLHTEHHPVDRFKLQGLVVEIDQLAQGIPGGQAVPLILWNQLLLPLVALLGCGQGVVAVPGSKEHNWKRIL